MISYLIGIIFFISSILSFFLSFLFYLNSKSIFVEWGLFDFFSLKILILFLIDWIRLRFCGVVTLISSLVIIYISYYIRLDRKLIKFVIIVFLFVISIILLIFRPNFISILLGWDGLGLVSYCLVIYYENNKSSRAGILTILSNRVGDVFILLRISLVLGLGRTSIFFLEFCYLGVELKFIFYLILLAAITKSAQIPFSAWLPAAMAAPTPVSSLVHSSTLVTAGVYLLIRFYNIFDIKYFLFVVSLFTIFMSGLGAIFERDLKKIIALSTLRQLGIIIITLCFGLIEMSFFHLLSHALFKSLLFLCAGAYIHSLSDWQDSRSFSTLWFISPIISFFFMVSSLSLCGFPFMSGFYSKDLIIEFFFISRIGIFVLLVTLLCILSTFIYSIRLFYIVNLSQEITLHVYSSADLFGIFIPIRLLFLFSFVGGALIIWSFFPLSFIYISAYFKLFVVALGLIRVSVSLFISKFITMIKMFYSVTYYTSLMWNLPNLSTFFHSNLLSFSFNYLKYFDQGWAELLGPQGLYSSLSNYGFLRDFMNLLNYKNLFFLFFIIYSFFFLVY